MNTPPPAFLHRKAVLATMHQKERVMKPLLEADLGLTCLVSEGFDTDQFGTFTGEKAREEDALRTLRKKCRLAMEHSGLDLGLASEGSFGPHPTLPFIPADEELVILIDDKLGLELLAREISTETNYDALELHSEEALFAFAEKAGFPEHGLILRTTKKDYSRQIKGIHDRNLLKTSFAELIKDRATVYAETDMRAMHNPSRMRVIQKATQKLIKAALSACPKCAMPGFSVSEVKSGLPCEHCGMPTKSTLSHLYRCQVCKHGEELFYPNDKKTEDPMYCNFCNP